MDSSKARLRGVSLGVALAIVTSVGGAVGWSSHPVGEESHPVFVPHRCFGDPPRQTPDPISPPCVHWRGDNGGATARGVTDEAVKVVLYNDLGLSGSMNKRWSESDEGPGHETDFQRAYLVRTVKSLVRYFNRTYETYGRTIRILAVPSVGGVTTSCPHRTSEAAVINHDHNPFAVTVLGDGMECFVDSMTLFGVPTVGFVSDLPRSVYESRPGRVFSFVRDLEEQADMTAGFICDKLRARPARYAGDPVLKQAGRRIALLFPTRSQRGPASAQQAASLVEQLEDRCGMAASGDGSSDLYIKTFSEGGIAQAVPIMLDLKLKGITTVLCYCVPVPTELSVYNFQLAATALGYYPEWLFDTASRMYRSVWHRQYSVQAQRSFGITPEWIHGAIESGYPYRAAARGGEYSPNGRFVFDIYHGLHVLFTGIQLAGPNLTPNSLRNGLLTYSHESLVGRSPHGAFGSGDNPYTFQRGALAWTWDPAGREPGHTTAKGCLRTRGHLSIDGEWQQGDEDLDGGGVCMGPHQTAGSDQLP